jgi:hypothetical protein
VAEYLITKTVHGRDQKYISFMQTSFIYNLRWSIQLFKKWNPQFRFLDNYYLLKNKKYLTDVKQHLKGLNFFMKVTQYPLLPKIMFQDGGYFGFKVI